MRNFIDAADGAPRQGQGNTSSCNDLTITQAPRIVMQSAAPGHK